MGHNRNTNPKQGFNVISACTNTWKETMTGWHKKQEDRILGLEQQEHTLNNVCQKSQRSFGKLQEDFVKLDEMVSWHEIIIPKLREDVGTSIRKVNSVLAEVKRKMEEFQEWIKYVKPMDMTTEISMKIVNSSNEIMLDRSPATTMETVGEQVEQLEGVV